MLSLDQIRCALSARRAVALPADGRSRAAVALVLRPSFGDPELLFIERATRAGDPWSGHMAFPGGRVEPEDGHPQRAAERETLEEVGVALATAECLGRLDDLEGRRAPGPGGLVVSAFVYRAEDPVSLVPNREVRQAFWVPLSSLLDPRQQVEYPVPLAPQMRVPGIRVGAPERHVVWGLTHRFLDGFFRILGHPLPDGRIRSGGCRE